MISVKDYASQSLCAGCGNLIAAILKIGTNSTNFIEQSKLLCR
jgi:hypothetical protein